MVRTAELAAFCNYFKKKKKKKVQRELFKFSFVDILTLALTSL